MKVWILSHTSTHEHYGDSRQSSKLIGVYTDKEAAQDIINMIKGNHGYVDYPDGFTIEEFTVDQEANLDSLFRSE